MTKDIILTISGLHATDGEKDEPVEIMVPGQYYFKNGKHYVIYDEVMEGIEGKMKSTMKFTGEAMELIRTGAASTRMIFEKECEHQMVYRTPMGPLSISLYTKDMTVRVGEGEIDLKVDYFLKTEGQILTESSVHMVIQERRSSDDAGDSE